MGILVPASPVKESYRRRGLKRLEELGYHPVEAVDILSRKGFVAKSPQDNVNDMQSFFDQPDIAALWAARGGYGSNYLLPLLKDLVIKKPKIVIGSSDLSVMLWYLMERFRMVVFYGPMAYSAISEDRFNGAQMTQVLEGGEEKLRIAGKTLVPGEARGVLTGGCLSNLVSLMGTPFFPETRGRILLLEDRGERPYRLDRMMWQLQQSGIFSRINGLVLGQFPGCFRDRSERVQFFSGIKEVLKGIPVPVVYDLPLGHSDNISTVPLGMEMVIDTGIHAGLIMTESAVC